MGKLLLAIIIFGTCCYAVLRPWLGIVAYYLLAILGPQYIWWWDFEGLRVSFFIAICTIVGAVFKLIIKELDYSFLKTHLNLWLFILWLSIDISYFFGPYVDQFTSTGLRPDQLFSMTNNMFGFYFLAVLIANDLKILRYLGYVFVAATLYMIYWANNQYFIQNWHQFNQGRLTGPRDVLGGAIYGDENALAMLFVTGIPFLYYYGIELQQRWLKYFMLFVVILGWHAVFLTGSRGGLLGLGVITVLIAIKSKKYLLVPVMLITLFVAFQWQGGDTMKQRSQYISDFEGERSAEDRLTAWKGGFNMVMAHPFTGVGLGSFITALPKYIDSRNMVAHNTFVQFVAESGVAAGLGYLVVVGIFFFNSKNIGAWLKNCHANQITQLISKLNNASSVSFAGLIACSLFLSLNMYEIFLYLLVINNSLMTICHKSTLGTLENDSN
ncbi:MAG: hypothetical protein EHM79_10360 [Geobacter sp.]|nr:MAG: hypothetical protein EHM79_10360 [Geobacter sp.]